MRLRRLASLIALIAPLAACSPNRVNPGGDNDLSVNLGGADGGTGGALTLMPADPVLTTDGKTAVTQGFQVFQNGQDVTAQASFAIDDGRVGMFSGATFTEATGGAGKTTVRASVGSATGNTTLTVRVGTTIIGKGAPPDSASRFGGAADAQNSPAIAYPPDGVLVPPNLNELEVQFDPSTFDLFELSFTGDAIDLKIYTTCTTVGTGCGFTPDDTTWQFLSGAGRGLTLQLTVRGTSMATMGSSVGTSASTKLSFGSDDVQGGLYYWAASAGGIFRYEFGRRGQSAEPFYTAAQASATCAGCHALSRNGKRFAAGLNIPGPAQVRTLDVATRTKLFEIGTGLPLVGGGANFMAWNSDGSRIVAAEGSGLTLRNGDTGVVIGPNPAVMNATMPDVSPDGTNVIFARDAGNACPLGLCASNPGTSMSNLYIVPFANDVFGKERLLVSGNGNNFYPSFSPDGNYVLFNRAAGTSYDNMAARLTFVATAGGPSHDLPNANAQPGNSWPKFAPFIQHFGGSTIFWLTFSSRRTYGLHDTPNSQIWMAAFQPDKIASGDASYPAFWLPFQDPATGNHIAQWVEKVERAPCSQIDQAGCMSNETCENGVCVPKIQ